VYLVVSAIHSLTLTGFDSFIFKIGTEIATACQPFGQSLDKLKLRAITLMIYISFFPPASAYLTDNSPSLAHLISSSQTTKARLLHYFPPSEENPLPSDDEPVDSWCGFHLDHSLCVQIPPGLRLCLWFGRGGIFTD